MEYAVIHTTALVIAPASGTELGTPVQVQVP